jgi:hypothetical protein
MQPTDWEGTLEGLIGIALGTLLLFRPYLIIRCMAKLARSYYSAVAGEDMEKAMNARLELPWSRYVQNGLPYYEFWKQAETNPQQFKFLSGSIRVMGALFLSMFVGLLLLVLILRVSGLMK